MARLCSFGCVALLALTACKGNGSIDIDTDDTELDTDDTELDTEDTDPGLLLAGTLSADAALTVPAGDVTIAMQGVKFTDDSLILGDIWSTDVVGSLTGGGSVDFAVPLTEEAPEASLFEWTGELDALDEEAAKFMVGAFIDSNSNGEIDEGEPVLGATFLLVAYLRGGPSQAMIDMGAEEGWNTFHLDMLDTGGGDTVTPIPEGTTDFPLDANLVPIPRGDLNFVVAPALGAEIRLDVYSLNDTPAPIEATVASTTVDATLAGATGVFAPLPIPPDDHFTSNLGDGEIPGLELAISQVYGYLDLNASNEYEINDVLLAASLAGGSPRAAAYMRATSFSAAVAPEYLGITAGWSLLQMDPAGGDAPPTAVPWGNGVVLAVPY